MQRWGLITERQQNRQTSLICSHATVTQLFYSNTSLHNLQSAPSKGNKRHTCEPERAVCVSSVLWLVTHLNNSAFQPCCPWAGFYKTWGDVGHLCGTNTEGSESDILKDMYTAHTTTCLHHSPLTSAFWISMKLIVLGAHYFIKLLYSILLFLEENSEIKVTGAPEILAVFLIIVKID